MGLSLQNLETVLNNVAADMSLQPQIIMDLFLQSAVELLSEHSGLPIALEFDADRNSLKVHAVRKITAEGIGFGEISQDMLQSNSDEFIIIKAGLGGVVHQYLQSIPLASDSEIITRNVINKINYLFKGKLNELAKEKEFNIFKDKEGELISGVVSRIEAGNIIVNVGLGEAFLSKHEVIPGEFFGIGSTVQAYVYEVARDSFKYQIKLTRIRPEFLGALMYSMIPEIESGLVEIKGIARDPGSRAKVAVYADPSLNMDPIGICIGRDGIRIKAIRALVCNERIDVVRWNPDIAVFIANALNMEIAKFVMHSDNLVEVVFATDPNKATQINSQQIRLVSRLVKRRIKLTSLEDDRERTKKEQDAALAAFSKIGLSDLQTRLLFANEIKSIEDMLDCEDDVLLGILNQDSTNQVTLSSLRETAERIYQEQMKQDYDEHGIDPGLGQIPHVSGMHPSFFKKKGVLSKSALAEMDCDEVKLLFEGYLSEDPGTEDSEAEDIVLWSRSGEGY